MLKLNKKAHTTSFFRGCGVENWQIKGNFDEIFYGLSNDFWRKNEVSY